MAAAVEVVPMERKEFDDLLAAIVDRLDSRYKLREDCDREMDVVTDRLAKNDERYAVINTKLSAILWLVGTVAVAVIGVLVKTQFGG